MRERRGEEEKKWGDGGDRKRNGKERSRGEEARRWKRGEER